MEQLQALLGSDKPWAQERAQLAIDLLNQFQTGEISGDEYKELLEDIIRTDVLDSEADDLETKTALVEGINAIMMFA
tara:strand:+ start:229 stop:459 length:231 start_codon:yes stop_codon:yes gene_type:complete